MELDRTEPTFEQARVTHVRASTLGGLFREIEAAGPGTLAGLVSGLSPAAAEVFAAPPGPFEWIEAPRLNELVLAFESRFGIESIDRRVHYTVRQQLSVIHGWILKLLSPETMFHQATTLCRFNFRGGIALAEEVRPGHARVRIWSHGLYPSWYTHAFPGWLTGALGLVGAVAPRVQHEPPSSGWRHVYEITWEG